MKSSDKLRIDKYLWCIRVFKTRTAASTACEKGRVKTGGVPVKASKTVNPGEEYEVRTEARKWIIRVESLIDHRVAYTEALKHYTDLTPEEEKDRIAFQAAVFHTGKRPSRIGRPTKKDRRDLEDFMD